jgi:hypothetical protein
VWSFAHFCEILVATVYGNLGCEEQPTEDQRQCPPTVPKRNVCCRKTDLDCEWLLRLLWINPEAPKDAATEFITAASKLWHGAAGTFDFTRAGTFSADMFRNLTRAQAEEALARQKVSAFCFEKAPLAAKVAHPSEILNMVGLATADDKLVLALRQDVVAAASADRRPTATLSPGERTQLGDEIKQARDAAGAAADRVHTVAEDLTRKTDVLAALRAEIASQTTQLTAVQTECAALRARLEAIEANRPTGGGRRRRGGQPPTGGNP